MARTVLTNIARDWEAARVVVARAVHHGVRKALQLGSEDAPSRMAACGLRFASG